MLIKIRSLGGLAFLFIALAGCGSNISSSRSVSSKSIAMDQVVVNGVTYTWCAYNGDLCKFSGTQQVVYGLSPTQNAVTGTFSNGVTCNYSSFNVANDPDVFKQCWLVGGAVASPTPSPSASQAPSPSGGSTSYTWCANNGDFCGFTGTLQVVYGLSPSQGVVGTFSNGVSCNYTAFNVPNDPNVFKQCWIISGGGVVASPTPSASPLPSNSPSPSAGSASYTWCAFNGDFCGFTGTQQVVYGLSPTQGVVGTFTNGVSCNYSAFNTANDPNVFKQCWIVGAAIVSPSPSPSPSQSATPSPSASPSVKPSPSPSPSPSPVVSASPTPTQSSSPSSSALDVTTYQLGNMRQGWNRNETALTLSNVNSNTFGKLNFLATDGEVTSQPLYLANVNIPGKGTHNVVYIATHMDSVYAFDADNGAQLWYMKALKSGESPGHGCPSFLDRVGISATPVIDRNQGPNGAIYLAPMSQDSSGASHQRLWALDVATGAPLFGGPVDVTATYTSPSNGTKVTMDPSQVAEVAALTLVNGTVYTMWGDPCEYTSLPHNGWIIGYNESTLAQTSVLNTTPNGNGGRIWLAGGGPTADSSGNLYVATGIGTFDSSLNSSGFPASDDYAGAVLKLSTAGGALKIVDYFSRPTSLANDFSPMGNMLIDVPDSSGTVRHLLTQASGGDLYVLDRDNMGKGGNAYQYLVQGLYGGGYTEGPAFFNGVVYYSVQWDPFRAFTTTNAQLTYRGDNITAVNGAGGPFVTSNGTSNGIVWKADQSGNCGCIIFHAFDANNLSKELYSNTIGSTSNNNDQNMAVTVVNGKAYVPTGGATTGLAIFGLK